VFSARGGRTVTKRKISLPILALQKAIRWRLRAQG
jgi:hypothetical protein